MPVKNFILRQYTATMQGGWPVFSRKLSLFAALPLAMLVLIAVRLLRPWIIIRLNPLDSSRIGHLAANVELYLCERDAGLNVPNSRYVDLAYHGETPLANRQLATMWGRQFRIWPAWILAAVYKLNKTFSGGMIHEVGSNTFYDRDVHNLLERMPIHLSFTSEEERLGKQGLRDLRIPDGSDFVCLIARDSTYLKTIAPRENYDYHNYRDVDIKSFTMAAEALADMGCYVVRMGAVVESAFSSNNPKVIDYACNGMRSDFMDIYLGANCLFCISTSTGFDAIPVIFRKPVAYVNSLPIGYLHISQKNALFLCKKHWLTSQNRSLTLREVFDMGVGFCGSSACYEMQQVRVVENTPEEIKALAVEMFQRLKGTWLQGPDDEALQRSFWDIYPVDARDGEKQAPLHGIVRGRYGAQFLRDNREWLT